MEIKTTNNHCKKLILFFTGWGMDEKAFSHLKSSNYDIITIYNYTNFDLSFCKLIDCSQTSLHRNCPVYRTFMRYTEINIIAFGCGVWAASIMFSKFLRHLEAKSRFRVLRLLKKIKKTIAINGTLCPTSNIWGIKQRIYNNTVAALKAEVESRQFTYSTSNCIQKFNLKMFGGDKELYNKYLDVAPQRGLEDVYNELIALKESYMFSNAIFWNKILIGTKDLTIPAQNQKNFWSEYELCLDKSNRMSFNAHDFSIEYLNTAHFPFFNWNSWEEIL